MTAKSSEKDFNSILQGIPKCIDYIVNYQAGQTTTPTNTDNSSSVALTALCGSAHTADRSPIVHPGLR